MSTLINLIISLFMSALFGSATEESKTVHYHELQKHPIEIFQELEARQHILDC